MFEERVIVSDIYKPTLMFLIKLSEKSVPFARGIMEAVYFPPDKSSTPKGDR